MTTTSPCDTAVATLPRRCGPREDLDAQERYAHVQDAAAAQSWRAVDQRRVPRRGAR